MCMSVSFNVKPYRKKKVAYKVVTKEGFGSIFANCSNLKIGVEYEAKPYRLEYQMLIGFHAYLKKEHAIAAKNFLGGIEYFGKSAYPPLTVVKIKVRDIQEAGIGATCCVDMARNYIAISARYMTILGEV